MSVQVSLTRTGLPRIIPPILRHRIRRRDKHADLLVRIYLSWFGLGKLIKLAPKVKKATFESITQPSKNIESIKGVLSEIKESFRELQPMYLPFIRDIPLHKGMTWQPTWKSTPLTDKFVMSYGFKNPTSLSDDAWSRLSRFGNCFSNLKHEIAAFIWNVNQIHSLPDGVFSPGILFYKRTMFALDRMNTTFAMWDLEYFEKWVGPYFSALLSAYKGIPIATGRLCCVIEGDGKRRILAIGNYVKQRLLRPIHDWAMKILSKLPSDGTFDQEAPIRRLRDLRLRNLYSFDLKSATDRWPLSVIHDLMSMMWGPSMASSIVNGTLGLNTFLLGKPLVSSLRHLFVQLLGRDQTLMSKFESLVLSGSCMIWRLVGPCLRVRPLCLILRQ